MIRLFLTLNVLFLFLFCLCPVKALETTSLKIKPYKSTYLVHAAGFLGHIEEHLIQKEHFTYELQSSIRALGMLYQETSVFFYNGRGLPIPIHYIKLQKGWLITDEEKGLDFDFKKKSISRFDEPKKEARALPIGGMDPVLFRWFASQLVAKNLPLPKVYIIGLSDMEEVHDEKRLLNQPIQIKPMKKTLMTHKISITQGSLHLDFWVSPKWGIPVKIRSEGKGPVIQSSIKTFQFL